MNVQPLLDLWGLLSLPPDRLVPALGLLGFFIILCEYGRVGLMVVAPRSRLVHLTAALLVVGLQPLVLALVLVQGARHHPERAWLNFGWVALLYGVWFVAGHSTRLVRPDSQGADPGFMTVGALITFGIGLVGVLLCG